VLGEHSGDGLAHSARASSPTSIRSTQKGFPSAAAAPAVSTAVSMAILRFAPAVAFFALNSLSCAGAEEGEGHRGGAGQVREAGPVPPIFSFQNRPRAMPRRSTYSLEGKAQGFNYIARE